MTEPGRPEYPKRTRLETWRARHRGESLEKTYWQSTLDDSDWFETKLPGQWASRDEFATSRMKIGGPFAYRTRFTISDRPPGERVRIVASGVFYSAHYWLDDNYLGDRQGYVTRQELDCTDQFGGDSEHCIAIELECPDQHKSASKKIITGVFSHWDAIPADFNPGGICGSVDLVATGPAYLGDPLLIPLDITSSVARMELRIDANSATETSTRLFIRLIEDDTGIEATGCERVWELQAGDNQAQFPLTLSEPRLWWPRALGEPNLYRLELELQGPDGTVWDRRSVTTGIRDIQVENWRFEINGERLFIRGSNYAPTKAALSLVRRGDVERDLALARDANLDLLRVHGHVGTPDLYETADRNGMLIWQDFPLQWSYARQIKASALSQIRAMVRNLGNHPSIAMWCCHNEPTPINTTDLDRWTPTQTAVVIGSAVAPTWNKNVLDPALRKATQLADPSRFVNEKSGELPSVHSHGTDVHLYFGWYLDDMRRFKTLLRRFPRLGRFVSEFGAQALPDLDILETISPGITDRWPDIDWDELDSACAQSSIMRRRVPTTGHETLASYIDATQRYQADLLRYHIETIRKLQYQPAGGFCQFQFNDSAPAVTWSVIDHLGRPKAGYEALRRANADVIIVADAPVRPFEPGSTFATELHVVSQLRHAIADTKFHAAIGANSLTWEGNVDADSVALVGRLKTKLPDRAGSARLVLTLDDSTGAQIASNSYDITIA